MSEPFEQDLQTGIRAARQGKNEAARRYLRSALDANPESEKAWLWLSRVVEDPGQRADCLQKALDLNPDNQWAAQQLQALQQESQPQEPGVEKPAEPEPGLPEEGPELTLKKLECPQCGAPLTLSSPAAKTITCDSCGSVIDLAAEGARVSGETSREFEPAVPLEPGMTGDLRGQSYQVIGWLKYRGHDTEEVWYWDEWLLAGGEGGFLWLSYDEETGFVLQEKSPPPEGFDPRSGFMFSDEGQKVMITERDDAQIVALAGELTWRAKVGDRINYADGRRGDRRYSFEFGKGEIEYFKGQMIEAIDIYRAFGLKDMVAREERKSRTRRVLGIAALLFMVFACTGLFAACGTRISGRRVAASTQPLTVSQNQQARLGTFEITQEDRPHRVVLRTEERYLPLDSWAVVDVSLVDEQGNSYYLNSVEFWHEDGTDEDGYWEESDIEGSFNFRPDTAGTYALELSLNSATPNVEAVGMEATMKGGVLLTWPFMVFAILAGGGGFVIFIVRSNI